MKKARPDEFKLIELIAAEIDRLWPTGQGALLTGIGDDTAVVKPSGKYQLATVDCLTEGVHFRRRYLDWECLGWKALAVNLSDIAAMGGRPVYALVSLLLPEDTEVENVMEFYRGLLDLASATGTVVAGGNISRAAELSVHVTVIGETDDETRILYRSQAAEGDLVAVTGGLGGAAAGFKLLEGSLNVTEEASARLRQAFWKPQPRLDEGQILARHGVKCAIDISDGLLSDLGHILKASGVGARLEAARVPLHTGLTAGGVSGARELAFRGGEDYELLLTAPREVIEAAAAETDRPISIIGRITGPAGHLEVIDPDGRVMPLADRTGWRHF